jgi:broad specificity phosphatase PhoE
MTRQLRQRVTMAVAIVLALLSSAAFQRPQDAGVTTVILVRHAEKAREPGDDPALDSLGQQRALDLAESLRGAGVDVILVTQYKRTGLTAEPLARTLHLTPRVIDTRMGGRAHVASVVDAAHAERGKTVLVVGHSNTIPLIVRALGGSAADMADADYDNLYVVMIDGDGSARTIRSRFGAAAHSLPGARAP